MLDSNGEEVEEPSVQDDDNRFPELYLNQTKPYLAYITIPKAGCSSVSQILNFIDTGRFIEGNVHRVQSSIMRWKNINDRDQMLRVLAEERPFWFSLLRNPYTRLFSSFSDKIFGYQDNGRRYRGGKVHKQLQKMGLTWGPGSNLIMNFRIFLKLVESNIEQNLPFPPDIHWAPQYGLLKANAKHDPEFKFDYLGHIESFRSDIEEIFQRAGINIQKLAAEIPKENSTAISKIPLPEFFGAEEIEIMLRIYAEDFEYLGYSKDPGHLKPLGKINIETINHSLRR